MSERILFVDDEPNVLAAYRRQLRKQFDLDTAESGPEGLELIKSNDIYSAVVADMQMPGMNGVEFLQKVKELSPESVRVMLTGNADQGTAVQAVNEGQVYRFLNKPCPADLLVLTLENAVQHFNLIQGEKVLLKNTLMGSVGVLTEILSLSLPEIFGKGEKLRRYVRDYLETYGGESDPSSSWQWETAAMLSRIGYVTVPEAIVRKVASGETLQINEQAMLNNIPKVGYELLNRIPRLESVAQIVRFQNHKFENDCPSDNDISGEQIPEGARVIKVLNDLVELEESRGSKEEALRHLGSRNHFYDSSILKKVIELFGADYVETEGEDKDLMDLDFEDIQIGDVLHNGISSVEGMHIVPPGTQVTLILLRRLHSFKELYEYRKPILVERETSMHSSSLGNTVSRIQK